MNIDAYPDATHPTRSPELNDADPFWLQYAARFDEAQAIEDPEAAEAATKNLVLEIVAGKAPERLDEEFDMLALARADASIALTRARWDAFSTIPVKDQDLHQIPGPSGTMPRSEGKYTGFPLPETEELKAAEERVDSLRSSAALADRVEAFIDGYPKEKAPLATRDKLMGRIALALSRTPIFNAFEPAARRARVERTRVASRAASLILAAQRPAGQ
jgi:hypothetical protein